MKEKNVTKLQVKNKCVGEGKLFLVPTPYDKCKHYNGAFEIDEDAGEAKCMECGEKVSLIFVLKRLMNKESRWMQNHDRYKNEMKRLSKRSRTKCNYCGKMTDISRK